MIIPGTNIDIILVINPVIILATIPVTLRVIILAIILVMIEVINLVILPRKQF